MSTVGPHQTDSGGQRSMDVEARQMSPQTDLSSSVPDNTPS